MDDPIIFCIYPSFLNNTKIKTFLILNNKKNYLIFSIFYIFTKNKIFST